MSKHLLRTLALATTMAVGGLSLVACTTTNPDAQASRRLDQNSLEAQANATLARLYETAPGSREMVAKARGVLIFPAVIGGSFVVGVEHGKGLLRVGGRTQGYYSTTGASLGWQAGGQSKAVIYVFSTQEALDKFINSNGWSVGADATVAVGSVGANGSVDSNTVQAPVVSYVMTNTGLEAGVSLQGSKVTKITPP